MVIGTSNSSHSNNNESNLNRSTSPSHTPHTSINTSNSSIEPKRVVSKLYGTSRILSQLEVERSQRSNENHDQLEENEQYSTSHSNINSNYDNQDIELEDQSREHSRVANSSTPTPTSVRSQRRNHSNTTPSSSNHRNRSENPNVNSNTNSNTNSNGIINRVSTSDTLQGLRALFDIFFGRTSYPLNTQSSQEIYTKWNRWRIMALLSILLYILYFFIHLLSFSYQLYITFSGNKLFPSLPRNAYLSRYSTLYNISNLFDYFTSGIIFFVLSILAFLAASVQVNDNDSRKIYLHSTVFLIFLSVSIVLLLIKFVISNALLLFDFQMNFSYWLQVGLYFIIEFAWIFPCFTASVLNWKGAHDRYYYTAPTQSISSSQQRNSSNNANRANASIDDVMDNFREEENQEIITSILSSENATLSINNEENHSESPEIAYISNAAKCQVPGCENYGNVECGGVCNFHYSEFINSSEVPV